LASVVDRLAQRRARGATPAGEFDAFRVEGRGSNTLGLVLQYTYWIAPERARRPVATEFVVVGSKSGRVYTSERDELISFRQLREPL
jgi:hypothetical protein